MARPEPPTAPCTVCGCNAWWWRAGTKVVGEVSGGEWLCGICHPNPADYKKSQFIYFDHGVAKKGEW
jgi:hypothetical protein